MPTRPGHGVSTKGLDKRSDSELRSGAPANISTVTTARLVSSLPSATLTLLVASVWLKKGIDELIVVAVLESILRTATFPEQLAKVPA